jgi:hypothetical protein
MAEWYAAENAHEYYTSLQSRINDGSIWSFEGSAGRAAMDAIDAGYCVLGTKPARDYWGNRIPSRYDVLRGTKGSVAYSRKLQGDSYVRRIVRIK